MEEIWKPIKGYENRYEVSNMGRVKSYDIVRHCVSSMGKEFTITLPGRIRKPNIMKGYHCIALIRDGNVKVVKIHRLVAETFISECPGPEYQINHKDGNKGNNCVDNLEWVTPKENTQHAFRTGLRKPLSLERRRAISEWSANKWKDPEYREFQSDHMHSIWNNPEYKKRRTEAITNGIHASKSKRYLRNRDQNAT